MVHEVHAELVEGEHAQLVAAARRLVPHVHLRSTNPNAYKKLYVHLYKKYRAILRLVYIQAEYEYK